MTLPYENALRDAGQLKVRALGLLVEPTQERRFDAAVLLHDAVRAERRALAALANPSSDTILASRAEQCGLLLDGFDVPGAAQSWGEVLDCRSTTSPSAWGAIVGRLEAAFLREQPRFAREWAKARTVVSSETFAPADEPRRKKVEQEVNGLLDKYPGVAHLWWGRFRALWPTRRKHEAWDALRRARTLAPENPVFEMIQLVFAAEAEPDADALVRAATLHLSSAPAEVCAGIALAELALYRTDQSRARLDRAREAIFAGRSARSGSDLVQRHLHALQLAVVELAARREPGDDILYRAGLSDLVGPRPGNVIDLVQQSMTKAIDRGLRAA